MLDLFHFDLDATFSVVEPASEALATEKQGLLATLPDLTKLLQTQAKARSQPLVSRMSRESLVAQHMMRDPALRDAFEERAAILEYDEHLPREEAEKRAAAQMLEATYGR